MNIWFYFLLFILPLFQKQLEVQKERDIFSEVLEYALPQNIAKRFLENQKMEGRQLIADHHQHCFVIFAEITGTYHLSSKDLLEILSHCFSLCDSSAKLFVLPYFLKKQLYFTVTTLKK